jgi:hypothetical protein
MSKALAAVLVLGQLMTMACVAGLVAFVVLGGRPAPGPSTFDFRGAGVTLKGELAKAVAATIRQAASELQGDDPIDQIKQRTALAFQKASGAAFDDALADGLDQIIPPGTTNPTALQRGQYAEAFLQAAEGLEAK